jgi:hypothetical protein
MDGGWLALGGGYYNYVREIPIGADYEIWLSIGGWDEKWVRHPLVNFFYRPTADDMRSSICSLTSYHFPKISRNRPLRMGQMGPNQMELLPRARQRMGILSLNLSSPPTTMTRFQFAPCLQVQSCTVSLFHSTVSSMVV